MAAPDLMSRLLETGKPLKTPAPQPPKAKD
jgi:hypothetical protein